MSTKFHVEQCDTNNIKSGANWEYVAKFNDEYRANSFRKDYANAPGNEGYLFRTVEREQDEIVW